MLMCPREQWKSHHVLYKANAYDFPEQKQNTTKQNKRTSIEKQGRISLAKFWHIFKVQYLLVMFYSLGKNDGSVHRRVFRPRKTRGTVQLWSDGKVVPPPDTGTTSAEIKAIDKITGFVYDETKMYGASFRCDKQTDTHNKCQKGDVCVCGCVCVCMCVESGKQNVLTSFVSLKAQERRFVFNLHNGTRTARHFFCSRIDPCNGGAAWTDEICHLF